MTSDNIATFNLQAAKILAQLYAAHPRGVDLGAQELIGKPEWSQDEEDEAAGTIRWLYDNGLAGGSADQGLILGAQLSRSGLRLLEQTETSLGGIKLGKALQTVTADPVATNRNTQITVELLGRRLAGL